jgi:hypothetical protein
MDANEMAMRQQFALARQGAASAMQPDDEVCMAVIREARENLAREKARQFIEQSEIFKLLHVDTTNDLVFNQLQALSFTAMGVQVIPGSYWRGTQDRGELVFERAAWDRWRENFDAIAERLGYVKPRQ